MMSAPSANRSTSFASTGLLRGRFGRAQLQSLPIIGASCEEVGSVDCRVIRIDEDHETFAGMPVAPQWAAQFELAAESRRRGRFVFEDADRFATAFAPAVFDGRAGESASD